MKKLSRIIMFVVLTLLMVLPIGCTITPEKSASGLVFELDLLSNTYTVVDYKANKDDVKVEGNKFVVEEVVIPSTFNGKTVAKIAKGAFKEDISIAQNRRHDWDEYRAFTQDGKETSLQTFYNNNGDASYYARVKKVVVPKSVKVIDDYAFQKCEELKEVVLDDSLANIGNSVFSGCKSLTTITLTGAQNAKTNQLPSAINKVSDGMFFNCTSLTQVHVPSNVKKIGKLAFASCTKLTKVTVEKENGDEFVMVGAESEVDVSVKDGLNIKTIDNYAFKGATKIEYVNVPNSVDQVGVSVFEMPDPKVEKSMLVGVSFSDNVTELGSGVFKNCVSLLSEKIDLSNITKIGEGIFEGCTALTSVQLNDYIEQIPENAYKDCTSIKTIDLAQYEKVNYIGQSAFRGCTSLQSVELGSDENSKIKDIKRYAFKDCPSLRSIYIPITAIRIEPKVFENSSGTVIYAKEIKGATATGEEVIRTGFSNGAANLIEDFISIEKVIEGEKVVAEYVILDRDGIDDNDPADDYACLARYVGFDDDASYEVPATIKGYKVEKILKAAFKSCDNLINVDFTVDSNVNSIDSEAFAYMTKVTSLDLTKTNIETISANAFAYSKSLQSITLPATVAEVKESAFVGCSALTSMDLSTVSTIGKAIFKDCSSLEEVKFGNIKSFPDQIFFGASNLKTITVEKSEGVVDFSGIKQIGPRAFYGCTSLNETNFGTDKLTGLTTIGAEAFYDCTGYTTFHLPKDLETIGDKAFAGCTSLASFDVHDENTSFYASAENVLYKIASGTLAIRYVKTAQDATAGGEIVRFTANIDYYSDLIYYPANSTSKNLVIDMKNTFTLGDIFDLAKENNGGTEVYAVTVVLTSWSSTFNRGSDYITIDGKKKAITLKSNKTNETEIKTVSDKSDFAGGNTYVVGKIGNSNIANYAFEGALELETIEFYGNVTIGTGAFINCSKLTSITVVKTDNNDKFADKDGVLYSGKYQDLDQDGVYEFVPTQIVQFPCAKEVGEYVMPDTIESVAVNAFSMAKIDKLVLSDKLGWSKDHGLNKAFVNADIGQIVINSKAVWNDKNALERYVDGMDVDDDKLYDNSNGKFIIDKYGILYSASISYNDEKIDGKTIRKYFLKYDELIYVPSGVVLSDKILTIVDDCKINPYAFSANDTLKTVILGKKISMVARSFDGCNDLTIYYQGSRIDYENAGYSDENNPNYKDEYGADTNMAFKNATVYYYSEDMVESDEYEFWHYKSAISDFATGAKYEYEYTPENEVPEELDGITVIHQDNELEDNYGYEYQLAINPDTGKYYKDEVGNWVIQTNNFGEKQFIVARW